MRDVRARGSDRARWTRAIACPTKSDSGPWKARARYSERRPSALVSCFARTGSAAENGAGSTRHHFAELHSPSKHRRAWSHQHDKGQRDGPHSSRHRRLHAGVEGTPVGILDAQCWARDPKEAGEDRRGLPIEEKESVKWLNSCRKVAEAQRLCSKTLFVSMGDREADIHSRF